MAFSLSSWFKGKPVPPTPAPPGEKSAAPAPARPAPPGRPAVPVASSVRKVVPNSVQPVSLRDPGTRGPVPLPIGTPPSQYLSTAAMRVTSVVQSRKVSFGSSAAPFTALPATPEPAVAPAPEAQPEFSALDDVVVTLELGDFVDRVPPTLLSGRPFNPHQLVEFHSSELYSDLSKGRASVPASIIYLKCPHLFARPVSETEDAEVPLPLQKLVEQLSPSLQTRADQVAEDNVGEIETPFLQVAMEDGARLPTAAGTSAGAIRPSTPLSALDPVADLPVRPPHRPGQIQTISPLKPPADPVTPPAAPAAAAGSPISAGKRPPSTVRASVAGGKIRLSGPTVPNRMSVVPAPVAIPAIAPDDLPPSATQRLASPIPPLPGSAGSPSHQVSKKTARIQIPPISLRGPGAHSAPAPTAPPRPVAASPSLSAQPGPLSVRQNGGKDHNAPIVFRSSPPPPATVKPIPHSFAPPPPRPTFPPPAFPAMPPAPEPPPAAVAAPQPASPQPAADERKITLGLGAVLRGLSSTLLAVEPSAVPDHARITLPFSLVEPQLSTGRVSIPQDVFRAALPEDYANVLAADADLPEIPLPLQEVFQNLPSNALTIRADQIEEEIGHAYPTPFSQKAEEDARRLGTSEAAVQAPTAAAAPAVAPELAVDRPLPPEETAAEATSDQELAAPMIAEEAPATLHPDTPLDLEYKAAQPAAESPFEAKTEFPAREDEPEAVAPGSPFAEPAVGEQKVEDARSAEVQPEEPVSAEADWAATEAETLSVEPPLEPAPEAAHPGLAAIAPAEAATSTPPRAIPAPAKYQDSELQVLFMTDDELDAKTVVKLVSQFPGLDGCAVMFIDGLRLAGNFPEPGQAEGFSAMAPPFFKRTKNFAHEAGLGSLQAFTIYTENGLCSFFMHDEICLSVRHRGRGFLPGVREKLEVVVRELARMYASNPPAESAHDGSH